jgi:hypothetical protein
MNPVVYGILCRLEAITEYAYRDNLTAVDNEDLKNATHGAWHALDDALERAKDREATLRKRGYLPPEGAA